MAEIKLSFDLTFSRRFITAAGAAAMMLCAVPELDSESVTLSTYYPAPSGVYTNMITTNDTYLARDVGVVRIGATTGAAKLYIKDADNAATSDIAQFFANNLTQGIGVGYNSIEAVGSNAAQDILLVPKGTGNIGIPSVSAGYKLNVVGAANVTGAANIGGVAQASHFVTAGVLQTKQGLSCTDGTVNYGAGGGTTNLCPGQYITLIDGIYSKKFIMEAYTAGGLNQVAYSVDYRCCPCPSSGCSGM